MGVQVVHTDTGTVIRVFGRFEFSCNREFRQAYLEHSAGGDIVVDMGETTYVDSAALGMLLLLRDHAVATGSHVVIANCRGQPSDVFHMANFDRLFKLR